MNTFIIEIQSEFEYITRAYQMVALMFGGSDYKGLLFTLGVLAIFFGAFTAIASQGSGGKATLQAWFMQFAVTSILIVTILNNKSTVIIHDTTLNQMTNVGGVPTVMAAMGYVENLVERSMKDMIETAMSPLIPYADIGNGQGFEILARFDEIVSKTKQENPHIMKSITSYKNECISLAYANGWIKDSDFNLTGDLWSSMKTEILGHSSVVYATPDDVEGSLASCKNAYLAISGLLTATRANNAVKSQCSEVYGEKMGLSDKCFFNTGNFISTMFNGAAGNATDFTSLIRSSMVAQAIANSSDGVEITMLNDFNKKNMAQAIMAEKTIPKLKGVLYGIIIMLFPLIVGFIWFNPIKTMIFYLGLYAFMAIWGTVDAFLDMQYQNEVYNSLSYMRQNGLGVKQLLDMPNKFVDALTLYGSGRWIGLALASTIVSSLMGISAYAMSQVGSQLSSSAQSAAGAGAGFMDSAGKTRLTEQAGNDLAMRNLDMVPNQSFNWQNVATATQYQKMHNMGSNLGSSEAIGGVQNAFDYGASQGSIGTQNALGSLSATQRASSAYGMSIEEYSAFTNNGSLLSEAQAEKLNAKYNTDAYHAGQTIRGSVGKGGKLQNVTTTQNINGGTITNHIGKNGELQFSQFSGAQDGANVNKTFDANGNVVSVDRRSGVSDSLGDDTVIRTMQGKEAKPYYSDQQILQIANSFSGFYSKNANISSNLKTGFGSGLLKKIGIDVDSYVLASDDKKADIVKGAILKQYQDINNSSLPDERKTLAFQQINKDWWNEYETLSKDNKGGRVKDEIVDELRGVDKPFLEKPLYDKEAMDKILRLPGQINPKDFKS